MRSGNRIASLLTVTVLSAAALTDVGCQQGAGLNVRANGGPNGGQVQVSGPNFNANIAGGPGGGRVDIDAPGLSFHGSGAANRPSYYPPPYNPPPYNGGYNGPYAPTAPAPNQTASNTQPSGSGIDPNTGNITLPVEPSSLGLSPAAPVSSDQALTRFSSAQEQKDGGDPAARAKADPISIEEAASEIAMFNLMNQVRRKGELGSLTFDKRLDIVARRHSEEMAALGYFDHTSPVLKNKTLEDRFKGAGVPFTHATENISRVPYKLAPTARLGETGRASAQNPEQLARDMMEGYLNSPGHRANILDPQVSRVGVGTVIGSQYAYNTQNFKD